MASEDTDARWERLVEDFELGMDGVSASFNIAKAALDIRYRSQVLSADDGQVVLMVDAEIWQALDDHIEMFMAFEAVEEEREQRLAQSQAEGEQQ